MKKIIHSNNLENFTKEEISKALYVISPLANMVREAYINTDTADGLLTRLRCSIAEMVDS